MQRDLRHKLKVLANDSLAITAASAPEIVQGTAVDTQGVRGIDFAIEIDEAVGTDVMEFLIYECDTVGGTYTAIDTAKYLKTGGDRTLVDPAADGALLTVGCTGTKQFVKPVVSTTTVADDLTVSVNVIKWLEVLEYDETSIDGLP